MATRKQILKTQETLLRLKRNDPTLTEMEIAPFSAYTAFSKKDGIVYYKSHTTPQLGGCIGHNTQLKLLIVNGGNNSYLSFDEALVKYIKRNASINYLAVKSFDFYGFYGGPGRILMTTFMERTSNLTGIDLSCCRGLGGGGNSGDLLSTILRRFTEIEHLRLIDCQLKSLPAIGHLHRLKELDLEENQIGLAGCKAIATLLGHPSCNLRSVILTSNPIDDECAIVLANALETNNTLEYIARIRITASGWNAFSKVVCNTSSINATHSSNHTLIKLWDCCHYWTGETMAPLATLEHELNANKNANKNQVAMMKIFRHHPNIDMKPFLKWDTMKLLPLVANWFDKALACDGIDDVQIGARKLSAIYQFINAMPRVLGSAPQP